MLRPKRKAALSQVILVESNDSDEENSKNDDLEYAPKKSRKVVPKKALTTKPEKRVISPEPEESKKIPEKKRRIDDELNGSTISTTSQSLWTEADVLSETLNINKHMMQNIIQLFDDDNTIPFMARYRKDMIGNLTADRLRDVKASYGQLLKVRVKQETIVKALEKENVLNDDLKLDILATRSIDELDHLYAPFKTAKKASLAEQAKAKGLQQPAEQILYGTSAVRLRELIDPRNGLKDLDAVREGVKNIISHIINRDTDVLEETRRLSKVHRIWLHSTLAKPKKSSDNGSKKAFKIENQQNSGKFETYSDFKCTIDNIKPHQILAINRGEAQKILKVAIELPDQLSRSLFNFLQQKYLSNKIVFSAEREELLKATFNEIVSKKRKSQRFVLNGNQSCEDELKILVQPLINRQIRKELTKVAEKASIDVFATNLKQLLLMSPVKGQRILGIDPGFTNGCKIALISECTDVLATDVIYPHTKPNNKLIYGREIANLMNKFDCTLIALGNGTACRETEKWLADLISEGILDSNRIRYSIVNEQGASIYSCSDIAKKEFVNMDVNLISAVSIARRLNDPLGELVKVEPKHLGVGMYQHDICDRYLSETLNEVVMECVSFVGVDINTASVTLLKHIAGLGSVRAENICKHRLENGPFKSREELKKVKQIGSKTFTQCAGFIRIEPKTAQLDDYNLLDSTWVHPESYDVAENIMKKCRLNGKMIGSNEFISKIKDFKSSVRLEELAKEFKRPKERINCVFDALERELLRDYRDDFVKKPLFKKGLTKISDLHVDTIVTGGITNVTHFGCFVDIGVEKDALIHSSHLGRMNPNIGDRVEAVVRNVDATKGRIGLKLKRIL